MSEDKINVSFKKCCICNNSNIGEFTIINGEKYHLCCIEVLQQENTQLKQQLNNSIKILKTITENLNNITNIENITDGEYTYDYIMNFSKILESNKED